MSTSLAPAGGRTILVTGGCGYLGSQLIRDLVCDERLGHVTVRILDNLQGATYQALMHLPVEGQYQFMEGDILDPLAVRLALQDVDAIVHLAAIVRTPMSVEHPVWVEQINHWGTVRLVDACLEAGVSRFIYASTAAVYGPGGPFMETDVCRPVGPYAQSKHRAELKVFAAAERGLRPTILRCGTLFGLAPVTRFDAVANRFAYAAGVGQPLTIYGNGEQKRPFIHIRDVSDVIRFCLAQPDLTVGQVFNVVSENASVQELAEALRNAKPDTTLRYTEQDVLTHLTFEADPARLFDLGWQPQFSVQAGMAELVAQFGNIAHVSLPTLNTED